MRAISMIASTLLLGAAFAHAQDRPISGAAMKAMPSAAMQRAKAPKGAKVFIESPKNGAKVGQDVTVKFGVSGIALKPATEPAPDSGHHHLLIDAKTLPPGDAPIPDDATHKHYGKAQTEDTIHLEPGTHTLQLDFGDAKHMQFNPPLVSKKITIHVQ